MGRRDTRIRDEPRNVPPSLAGIHANEAGYDVPCGASTRYQSVS